MTIAIEVLRAGPLLTVQDLGRRGHAHLGVPRSGAVDDAAHRRANDAVGNSHDEASLEVTLLGCTLRARGPVVLAVAGAACDVFVGGVRAPFGAPFRVAAGQVVEVGPALQGLRTYVAVRGGIGLAPVLGSRSTDTLSGLGPDPLAAGDVLPVGDDGAEPAGLFAASATVVGNAGAAPGHAGAAPGHAAGGVPVQVALRRGPRDGWLAPDGWTMLERVEWTVSQRSNRVGLRLEGAALPRARSDEIPSEGMVPGAVQLPPSGEPVIFLADHPTTGGYPVIGVVRAASLSAIAQARPGDRLILRTR